MLYLIPLFSHWIKFLLAFEIYNIMFSGFTCCQKVVIWFYQISLQETYLSHVRDTTAIIMKILHFEFILLPVEELRNNVKKLCFY